MQRFGHCPAEVILLLATAWLAMNVQSVRCEQLVYESRSTRYNFDLDVETQTWRGDERHTDVLRVTGAKGLEAAGTFAVAHGDLVSIASAAVRIRHSSESKKWLDVDLLSNDVSPDAGDHTTDKVRIYLIPGLRIGDEVRIEIVTHHKRAWEIPGHVFGGPDSVRFEALEFHLPRTVLVDPRIRGGMLGWPTPQVSHTTAGNKQVLHFEVRGLPPRPMMDDDSPAIIDLQPIVRIGTLRAARARGDTLEVRSSWASFAKWYEGRLAPMLELDKATQEWIGRLSGRSRSNDDLIATVFRAVQTQVRYMAISVGEGGWIPHPVASTRANGYGDCKDMASLLVAGLRHAGVQAFPALVRTRGAGVVDTSLPYAMQFDHCVAYVPDPHGDWWLDATDPNLLPGEVSHFIDGNPALVLAGDHTRFVRPAPRDSVAPEFTREYRLSAESSGRILVEFRFEWHGALAAEARGRLRASDPSRQLAHVRAILQGSFLAVTDLAIHPPVEADSRPILRGTCVASTPFSQRSDQFMMPRGIVKIDLPEVQPSRSLPFVVGPRRCERVHVIARLPGSVTARDTVFVASRVNRFARLEINVRLQENILECSRMLQWDDTEVPIAGMREFVTDLGAMRHLHDETVSLSLGRNP